MKNMDVIIINVTNKARENVLYFNFDILYNNF
jgi:hypothetical protein